MSVLPRDRVLALLDECTGDHVWSIEHCRRRGLPADWIEELADAYESGFQRDTETLYTDAGVTNQYHGVRDFDLAVRLGRLLGVDVERVLDTQRTRASVVSEIKRSYDDD